MKSGVVYLVGAGCGDFDLITVRGLEVLKKAEVIVYDSLIDSRILNFVPCGCELISVGKRAGAHSFLQEEINSILIKKSQEGKFVVRLKGGDPFVFGRGGEEVLALQSNNISYSIVPGVTSAVAVPELAGIPVTHRGVSRSVHIITGHTVADTLPSKMAEYAKLDGTLVFLMGLNKLKHISESLIKNGKSPDTPAAVISNGSTDFSVKVRGTLDSIVELTEKNAGVKSPAVIVIGKTVDYDFSPSLLLPLKGKSVAITGTLSFAEKLSHSLTAAGARVDYVQRLEVVDLSNSSDFVNAITCIGKYNVIVLTSVNGVHILMRRLAELCIDIRTFANIRFAVIGSGTSQALKNYGIIADYVPFEYTSRALGNLLAKCLSGSDNILILRAENGSSELTEILESRGLNFNEIKIYGVKPIEFSIRNKYIENDYLVFGSSSGVDAFFSKGFKVSENTKIICIGSTTAGTLEKFAGSNYLISRTSDVNGIVEKIISEVENEKIQTSAEQ